MASLSESLLITATRLAEIKVATLADCEAGTLKPLGIEVTARLAAGVVAHVTVHQAGARSFATFAGVTPKDAVLGPKAKKRLLRAVNDARHEAAKLLGRTLDGGDVTEAHLGKHRPFWHGSAPH